jgi:curved DNA-binding protein CbpA
MKRISQYRKVFEATSQTDLATLKLKYRNLIKEWHPDKFQDDEEKKIECELKSKEIIEAYHFLVSINPETLKANEAIYANTTNTSGITDFEYKNLVLKLTFQDGSVYEYFNVPKTIYSKLVNTPQIARFARRHIYTAFTYRNASKANL